LTIEAVRGAGLALQAVVLTPWPASPTPMERSNLETIAGLGSVEVETLPRLQLDWPESWPALDLPEPDRRLEAA
jgi:hypothetical protein